MLSFQQQTQPQNATQQVQQNQQQQQQQQAQAAQDAQHGQQQNPAIQTMRLREDPPPITPAPRTSRKRKSPPSNNTDTMQQQAHPPPPVPQQQQPMQHVLPPPHALMHTLPGPLPPGYPYPPADYTPGGIPPPPQHPSGAPQSSQQQQQQQSAQQLSGGRTLSNSKRAEQNRKAQRAFRERRDQHVKALESRSQLLDAALASADEANRRWEECRALVDQLRVENAALRAALSQAQLLPPSTPNPPANANGASAGEESKEHETGEQLDSSDPATSKKD